MTETGPGAADTPRAGENAPQTIFDRVPLGLRMLIYGVLFLASVLGLLPWLAYQVDVYWPQLRLEIGWLRALGVVFGAACLAVYIWSSYLLSHHGRGAYVEFDPPRQFVATGPFRWCRNPIAGSLVGVVLGEAIAFSSVGIFLLFIVALPLAHIQVILLEEPLLRKRFGAAYEEYLTRVPRWLPRPPRGTGS